MAMQWKYSNGYDTSEFLTDLSFDDDYALGEYEKDLILKASATASSKTLTLGLADNQPMLILNAGDEAFTAANLKDDSGQSIGANELYLVIGSSTADSTSFIQLGGGGDNQDME